MGQSQASRTTRLWTVSSADTSKPFPRCSESILIDTLGATVLQQNGQDTVTFKNLSDETEGGRKNRTRLLRCWLELAIWLEHAKRVHGGSPSADNRGAARFVLTDPSFAIVDRHESGRLWDQHPCFNHERQVEDRRIDGPRRP